jgi:hypothetical protein
VRICDGAQEEEEGKRSSLVCSPGQPDSSLRLSRPTVAPVEENHGHLCLSLSLLRGLKEFCQPTPGVGPQFFFFLNEKRKKIKFSFCVLTNEPHSIKHRSQSSKFPWVVHCFFGSRPNEWPLLRNNLKEKKIFFYIYIDSIDSCLIEENHRCKFKKKKLIFPKIPSTKKKEDETKNKRTSFGTPD